MREEKNSESNRNSKKLLESWPLQSLEVIWSQWRLSSSYAEKVTIHVILCKKIKTSNNEVNRHLKTL
jgi:hypothetical protein